MSGVSTTDVQQAFVNGRTLTPEAVLSNLGLMSGVSLIAVVLFNILRPQHKVIYAPKEKYHKGEKAPPRASNSIFGWIPPLVRTRDEQLFDLIGLDAVAFLRFLRLCRQLFLGAAIVSAGILIPINLQYNRENRKGKKQVDFLTRTTLRDVYGEKLWAHIACAYLITILLIGLVAYHWKKMVELRHRWFTSPEYANSFYSRTISIINIPEKHRSENGLHSILSSTKLPYPMTSVSIGRKVGILPDLIELHSQAVKDLEEDLVKYLKNGKIGSKRPTVRVGGFLGLGKTEYDAIEYHSTKVKTYHDSVIECRKNIDMRKAESYGFASLATVEQAHSVARKLQHKHPKSTDIMLAMNPKDIIWRNMPLSKTAIARKRFMGWIWICLLCTFSLIPAALVSILAVMDVITSTGLVPRLQNWSMNSPATYAIVSGSLPPIVSAIWTFFLPKLMRRIAKNMGAKTSSQLDRAVIARFFAFLVISQLLIFTIWGVIFTSVVEVIALAGQHRNWKDILLEVHDKLPGRISRAYIQQASYWLKFLPLRGFLVVFDLAQLINLIWITIKTRLWGRTPRSIRDWTQPQPFDYPVYYSNLLFTAAVGLLFAPLAPLVPCAAAVVFWLSSFVYKYQLLFVFVSKVESGGRIWNVIINRLLFCGILMQAVFSLTIGLHVSFNSIQFYTTLPLPVAVIIAKWIISASFSQRFYWYTPKPTDHLKTHSSRADANARRLEQRFGHPALHADLLIPMLHEKMMPLLNSVYNTGNSEKQSIVVELKEYGGEKMNAQLIDGLAFASVAENILEYDPALYQRDRGEAGWETSSIASSSMLSSPPLSSPGSAILPRQLSEYYAQTSLSPSMEGRELLPGPSRSSGYFDYRPAMSHSRLSSGAITNASSRLSAMMNHPPLSPGISPQGQWYQNQPSAVPSSLDYGPSIPTHSPFPSAYQASARQDGDISAHYHDTNRNSYT